MPGGLSLKMRGYGGVGMTGAPAFGTQASYGPPVSATQAAFGPGSTARTPSAVDVFCPNDGLGVAIWAGIIAIGLLAFVRHSLPN
jgi:hypothetical protein